SRLLRAFWTLSAHAEQLQPLSIEPHIQLVRAVDTVDRAAVEESTETNLHGVFAIGREVVAYDCAAPRKKRRFIALALKLRKVRANRDPLGPGPDGRITHCQAADLLRGEEIALQQTWRDGQHIGDVVKTVSGFVGRQYRGAVNLEREQVPDGVRVFESV